MLKGIKMWVLKEEFEPKKQAFLVEREEWAYRARLLCDAWEALLQERAQAQGTSIYSCYQVRAEWMPLVEAFESQVFGIYDALVNAQEKSILAEKQAQEEKEKQVILAEKQEKQTAEFAAMFEKAIKDCFYAVECVFIAQCNKYAKITQEQANIVLDLVHSKGQRAWERYPHGIFRLLEIAEGENFDKTLLNY
jgi:hypothetical protein